MSSRFRLASTAFVMWKRDDPTSFGPSPLRKVPLVEISTRSRRPAIARPRISSDCPCEYTSALSNIATPASRHTSTRRVASLTSLAPQGLKKSVRPPNVPVPKVRIGTFSPELPSCRYSICVSVIRTSGRRAPPEAGHNCELRAGDRLHRQPAPFLDHDHLFEARRLPQRIEGHHRREPLDELQVDGVPESASPACWPRCSTDGRASTQRDPDSRRARSGRVRSPPMGRRSTHRTERDPLPACGRA